MGQEVSFQKEDQKPLAKERNANECIILIIGAFCHPGGLDRSLLTLARRARVIPTHDDKNITVETLRSAVQQGVNTATRKSLCIFQPSSWLYSGRDLYAFDTYPVLPALNTVQAALKICEATNSASISGQDLMALNLLLDDQINTTYWAEKNKTLYIPGPEVMNKVYATGLWVGFGQKPCPGQFLSAYSLKEGYFCGRRVKEENEEQCLISVPSVRNALNSNTPKTEGLPGRGTDRIQEAHVKKVQAARERCISDQEAARILLSLWRG